MGVMHRVVTEDYSVSGDCGGGRGGGGKVGRGGKKGGEERIEKKKC
jgi:hypothetical protein